MIVCFHQRLLLILLCVKCSWSELTAKILGGYKLKLADQAYNAQFFNAGGFCGCSLVTSWAIMTAAHCFENNLDVELMFVRVGNGGKKFDNPKAETHYVLEVQIHHKYNKKINFSHDIAIVFLQSHMKLRPNVQRALLATSGDFLKDYTPNAFMASGWGWTSYPKGQVSDRGLLAVNMSLVPLSRCARIHNVTMSHDMFCLYGGHNRDTCKGDSGGAVIWKRLLVGIVSHGDGCGKQNLPSIYANVWHFRSWISRTLANFQKHSCNLKRNRSL